MATEPNIPYFAYGSNLDEDQLLTRCPSAAFQATATLPGYRLAFDGSSRTWHGCGVASLVPSAEHAVVGAIFRMNDDDLAALDQFEGHPHVYERTRLRSRGHDGSALDVWVYLRRNPELPKPPHADYLARILAGYRRFGFDPAPLLGAILASNRTP